MSIRAPSGMRIVDAYPASALTPFGGVTTFVVEVERVVPQGSIAAEPSHARLRLELLDLGAVVSTCEFEVLVPAGASEHSISMQVPSAAAGSDAGVSPAARGYQVRVTLAPTAAERPSQSLTAVLVADHWRHAPRYGFLSEFAPEDASGADQASQRVGHLAKHHITIVQFYDWMYRHYQLLPPADHYSDALNRELSLTTVRGRIDACHRHGMAAIAYGAVYGPEPEFILERPEWLLYDSQGDPISLIELFYITDLRAGSGWREHILREFEQAVRELDFDGIHMDQYGFPKLAYDNVGAMVDLAADFPSMIDEAAARLGAIERAPGSRDVGVIFNAVNDWPIDTVAVSDQECVYIEVWDPHSRYSDLVDLVRRARDLSGKQAILSAYLQPFRDGGDSAEWALRYATAIIAAAGGHHLVLGEGDAVLRDPYYPNHGRLSAGGAKVVRRYYDHTAAFTDVLHALDLRPVEKTFTTGVNTAFVLTGAPVATNPTAGSVYFACSQRAGQFVINLVNLTGVTDDTWDAHKLPAPLLEGLVLECEPFIRPTRVVHASPDGEGWPGGSASYAARVIDHVTGQDGRVRIALPPLSVWSTIVIDHD